MPWSDLYGAHILRSIRTDARHPFVADANGVAFELDDWKTVFVFENKDDGYRSSSDEPLITNSSLNKFGIYPEYINVPVEIVRWSEEDEIESGRYGKPEGIKVIDKRNELVILLLGTRHTDDYYPCFTCDWRPQNIFENAHWD